MKRKTVKARKTTVKAKTVKTRAAKAAFYKAPLNLVSNSFNSFVEFFK
ncbi:MAG: hypothetical protein PHH08_01955 [Candidatus ainarchaeum sp.]|nr:hypothetical protein [Candidatus ainarchaeum sp.]